MEAQPVAHPSDYILEAFASGKLDNTGGQAVRAHLEVCPACRARANLSSDRFRERLRAVRPSAATAANAVSPGDTRGGNAAPEANKAAGSVPATPYQVPSVPAELRAHPQHEILRELGRGGMGVV